MSEPTPIDLPVGLRWIKLVYRLGQLVTDSTVDDDPHPDLLPVGGTLTLTATPDVVRIQEADGRWRSVDIAGRTYTIRSDGELVDGEGRVGVWIPDPASLLVEPQGYAITAVVKPTTGKERRVTIGGSTVLPDVVDLVAVSSVGRVSPSVTASLDARLYALETGGAAPATHEHTTADIDSGEATDGHVLTADGAGGAAWEPAAADAAAATHEALTIDGDTTLPSEHQVITLRVSSPATLSIADAPDGTVITAHVAYGWEDIAWAPEIVVQGETSTTETWLVLVRSEGEWKVLVSGESADSGGDGGSIAGLNVVTGSWPPPLPDREYPEGTLFVRGPQVFSGPVVAVKSLGGWEPLALDRELSSGDIDSSVFTTGIGEVFYAGWVFDESRSECSMMLGLNETPEPGDILCTINWPGSLTDVEQDCLVAARGAGVLTGLGGGQEGIEGIHSLIIDPYEGVKYLWSVAGAPLAAGDMLQLKWPVTIQSSDWL